MKPCSRECRRSRGECNRIRSEHPDAAVVANWYEVDVRASAGSRVSIPRFDLVVLGIGTDRHTASLFQGTPALAEHERLVVANWVEKLSAYRITMTLPLINAARVVMFIAAGEEKADAVRGVLQPKDSVPSLLAQFVRPVNGKALRNIREIVLERRAQNILVVSHKATIRLVIASLLGLRLMLFNDVSHYAHQLILACSSHTETALARR